MKDLNNYLGGQSFGIALYSTGAGSYTNVGLDQSNSERHFSSSEITEAFASVDYD
jgi:hypothetical protein